MIAKLLAGVLLLAGLAFQAAPPGAGVIVISLLNRPVGVERFDLRSTPQGFELSANMDVTERGAKLQLASTLVTTTDFTPTRFISKGKPYRFVCWPCCADSLLGGAPATCAPDSVAPIAGPRRRD